MSGLSSEHSCYNERDFDKLGVPVEIYERRD